MTYHPKDAKRPENYHCMDVKVIYLSKGDPRFGRMGNTERIDTSLNIEAVL